MVAMLDSDLLDLLNKEAIPFRLYHHEPIFGAADAAIIEKIKQEIPGAHVKNLFLKTDRGYFLITMLDQDRVDLKALKLELKLKDLSFASSDALENFLGVRPGSVTPLAVINDLHHDVQVIIDTAVIDFDLINVHPLRNDQTVSLKRDDLERFFRISGHEVRVMHVPKSVSRES